MINLLNITKKYKDGINNEIMVLNNLSLNIETGDYISIIGTSGVGKTTLLNIISCIEKPDSGDIIIAGDKIKNLSDEDISILRNKFIAYIFQDYLLIEEDSVYDNIIVPLLFNKEIKYKDFYKLVKDALFTVDLDESIVDKKVSLLSGGQKQRVAIARAIINNPKIILADEPTGSLDPLSTENILELFTKLNEKKITIVLVTHDMGVANHAKKIYEIKDGKIFHTNPK